MRCSNCGAELKPGAKFCGKCGHILSESPSGGYTGGSSGGYTGESSGGYTGGSSGSYTGGFLGGYTGGSSGSYTGGSSGPATEPKPGPRRSTVIDTAVNRMPQGIALGVGEQIVKQYKVGRYTFRQGSIEVIVTNKRVIRYEESSLFGMQNNQIDEINIDAVHGR